MRSRFALLPIVVCFCALAAWAAVPMTKLNVQVTSQGGKPIERADIVVKFVKGRSTIKLGKKIRVSWEMRTNQEGIAKVPEIPQGTILIQVIAKGYQTFGQTFDVDEAEKTIPIKLNAPQEQYSAH
jgi:cytochrome c oxidase assembly protein Cox11